MARNYLDEFTGLHQTLSYYALDLGYKYGTTAGGGTIYIVLPPNEEDEITHECSLIGWPRSLKRRKDFCGYFMENPLVFHLWENQGLKKAEQLRVVVERIALSEHYENDLPEKDHCLDD